MLNIIFIIVGVCGSFIMTIINSWDGILQTLVLFMAIDWLTGGILLPIIFKKSPKSETGTLESRAGWKGLVRKCMTLFLVLVAARIDLLLQTNYLKSTVCIAFIANEALSIVENAGLMGIPLPKCIIDGIDLLRKNEKSI